MAEGALPQLDARSYLSPDLDIRDDARNPLEAEPQPSAEADELAAQGLLGAIDVGLRRKGLKVSDLAPAPPKRDVLPEWARAAVAPATDPAELELERFRLVISALGIAGARGLHQRFFGGYASCVS